LHLGEISLECSRPGASAVALWATQRLMPLEKGGEFANDLGCSLSAARNFHARLDAIEFFTPLMAPELDIVVYAVNAADTTTASASARRLFDSAADKGLHLALIELPVSLTGHWLTDIEVNSDSITCLRSVLMKPEHQDWTQRIVAILEECVA